MGGDIRKIFMMGQKIKGKNPEIDLIDLSLGNPDLEPPQELAQSLSDLVSSRHSGNHRYMDSAGLLEVREFLAKELSCSEGVSISQDSVYLTLGAAGAIQLLFRIFLDKNDEVILFSPFFPEYIPFTENFDAKPVIVRCDDHHLPLRKELEKKISKKTKIVVINTPNNPSGVAYNKEVLEEIIKVLEDRKRKYGQIIHLISDEPYSRIVYENVQLCSLLKMYEHSWLVRSFSKDLGLAGERIGFIAWKKKCAYSSMINAFRNSSRVLGFVSAPRLMQRLLPYAYNAKVESALYQKRVLAFIKILSDVGIETVEPAAGFFVFPKSPVLDDRKFCRDLVKQGVLCVPGSAFGCPGYFRASLTQTQQRVEEAAKRIVNFVKTERLSPQIWALSELKHEVCQTTRGQELKA